MKILRDYPIQFEFDDSLSDDEAFLTTLQPTFLSIALNFHSVDSKWSSEN